MKSPFLIGNRIYLRSVSEEDVTDDYVNWLSDPEVTKFMNWRAFPSTKKDILEYISQQKFGESLFLAIIVKETEQHIGNIHLGTIDWINRRAELAMILGEKSAWGKGYMTEAFDLVISHAFNALNLNKIKAGTEEGNIDAIKLFQKTGWIEEGRIKKEVFREGVYRDIIFFAKFNNKVIDHRRVVATIEARMTSSRLPGKVLTPIIEKPALAHLIERLKHAKFVHEIIIATTINPADDQIEKLANSLSVKCYRGSEEDVMGRVVEAAAFVNADIIVEITGDCVLLDPQVIDIAVEIYLTNNYDIVTNTLRFSYPQGVDAQVFSYKLLADAAQKTNDRAHREHVSLYFYENPDKYIIYNFEAPPEFTAPNLRFQLDYREDLEFISKIYEELYDINPEFSLKNIFDLLDKKPYLKNINSHMKEKALR